MKHRFHLLCLAVLATGGCNKAPEPPAPQQQIDPAALQVAADAADQERATRVHLKASMTDAAILRAIGVDPASVKPVPAPEGYGGGDFIKTAYTNATMDIEISRKPSTGGLLVYQADKGIRWLVKGNAP